MLLAVIMTTFILAGCGKVTSNNNMQQDSKFTSATASDNQTSKSIDTSTSATAITSSDVIDFTQYLKKVWIVKSWDPNKSYDNYFSFCIYKIANGKIEGKFSIGSTKAVPDDKFYSPNYFGNITGTINNGIAECTFNDKNGDKGNIKLVFKSNDEIEATIKYISKSEYIKDESLDGTFQFRQYNLKDIFGFSPFKDQSFTVDLNSWGTIRFVAGKVLGGNHIPTEAYLTDKDGNVFYDLTSFIPTNVNVKAVSFQDINKDGLKDIVIIFNGDDVDSCQYAEVFFQKTDSSFYDNEELDREINASGNNKDIKAITDYLLKKL